jgi:hypothetical protein
LRRETVQRVEDNAGVREKGERQSNNGCNLPVGLPFPDNPIDIPHPSCTPLRDVTLKILPEQPTPATGSDPPPSPSETEFHRKFTIVRWKN